MIKYFTAAAAACLLAATPALAERERTTHTTAVHTSNGNGHQMTRTMQTTHVNVIRGNQTRGHTVNSMTTTRQVHGNTSISHHTNVTMSHHTNVTVSRHTNVSANVRSFQRNFTATRRYHYGSVYNRPHGWYSHRWIYGEHLPGGWYGQDYWIPNYVTFGLIGPPDGYQWVRVGDDALLVDVDTGEVLQVEYDVFY